MVEEKRQLIDLALQAARHYESPQTGLIHFCYEDEGSRETIPLFENFCFCLALLRTFSKDNVEEAKERLERLLAFQLEEGNFPTYLHQYPNRGWSRHPFFPLQLISKHFPFIKVNAGISPPRPKAITSSKDAALEALHLQLEDQPLQTLAPYWDPDYHLYAGPLAQEKQRGSLPDLTLFDLFMANATRTFTPRILKLHPVHLQAALVFPTEEVHCVPTKGERTVWQEGDHLHTLVCDQKIEEGQIIYPEEIPDEKKRTELSFYVDHHPDLEIRINGEKGTVFRLGDRVTIHTPTQTQTLILEKGEGEGAFLGHISRGNRPSQLLKKDFIAYDWRISLRTLRRSSKLTLLLSLAQVSDCQPPHPSHASHCQHTESPQ
ncbi:hypothetical protein [Candidatus Neptunochlamydia vexilliferae]|uniref:hypothetical protein n=1 Tax=Candidatus Neptunichlamydia vexilliferae TaxID=1651774 RepID=UPI001891816A|nr:hypothetical protein [Candidatus Neptunochlamydia vexilliferae]